MRLGISSHAFAWAIGVPGYPAPPHPLSAQQLIEQAAMLKVRVAQIADNLPLDLMSETELHSLIDLANERGIDLEVGTAGITPERLRRYLNLAVKMQSPIVRTLLDDEHFRPSGTAAIDILRHVIPDFEGAGVCLAIENHDRFPAAILAQIVESLESSSVGICLDTANSLGCGEGLETVLRRLAPWVVNLHVKDFRTERLPHKKGFLVQGCPLGEGQLDIASVLAELRKHDRRPSAIIESWVPPESTMPETVAKELTWAASSVTYLRRWIPD